MRKGQRVEVIDFSLKGEKATVCAHPKTGKHRDGDSVWIKFDRDGARVGYAILDQQWFEIARLKKI